MNVGGGYSGRRSNPEPPAPSGFNFNSRVADPSRLEARRTASGSDWKTIEVVYELDGAGGNFLPDAVGYDVRINFAGTISQIAFWDADGGAPSINFDLWRKQFDDGKPTIADTILPAAIDVVATDRYSDVVLANVNRVVQVGDVIKLFVNSASGFKRGCVALTIERSI